MDKEPACVLHSDEESVAEGAVKQVRTQEVIAPAQSALTLATEEQTMLGNLLITTNPTVTDPTTERKITHLTLSLGPILKLAVLIGLVVAAAVLLWQAITEQSIAGSIAMAVVILLAIASLPFLLQDWRLARKS